MFASPSRERALASPQIPHKTLPMILVTGATGFVGNHVARALVQRGEAVRILIRKSSNLSYLSDLPQLEKAVGDLRDKTSLDAAVKGCSQVYHVAADYRF